MSPKKTDITQMTDEEALEFLKQRKRENAKLTWETAVKAKGELEAHCQKKYGLSLAAIFTTPDEFSEARQYKHPEDGSLYSYSGRGKVPAWLKGEDGKPNPKLQVTSPSY
jgi:hypothetical protein